MFECYEEFEEFVSRRISQLREQANISARDMSLSLGLGAGYINNIENKKNMPSMQGFFYICEFFKITPEEFFDEGLEDPESLAELINECKGLDRNSIQSLLSFIRNVKNNTTS